MSGFDAGWLALREPFDAAARDGALAARFIAAVVDRAARRNRAPSASKRSRAAPPTRR